MRSKCLTLALAFVPVFALGLLIGYTLKPSVDVRLSDPADLGAPPPVFDANSPSYKRIENDPVVGPLIRELEITSELKAYQPVGRFGPFDVYVNTKTGGYRIGEDKFRQTVLFLETRDGRTTLTLLGKRQETRVTLTYDEATGKRISAVFEASEGGGIFAPRDWHYVDIDGDGRFDRMIDLKRSVVYEQRGLQWIEVRRWGEEPNAEKAAIAEEQEGMGTNSR